MIAPHRVIVPHRFVAGRWQPDDTHAPAHVDALTLVTWNAWFSPFCFAERFRALLREIRTHDPDVICLQEILPESIALLRDEPWIRARYLLSDVEGDTLDEYGVVLLSRLPLRRMTLHDLFSNMGRRLLVAELDAGEDALSIGTVHLESLKHNAEMRADQLQTILPLLRAQSDNCVLAGDFNFCAAWNENALLPPDFVDTWPALRPREPGYTEATSENAMLLAKAKKETHVRFDRVLVRSLHARWRPSFIQRLGTMPVAAHSPEVFASDHFGLVARIERTIAPSTTT